MDSDKPFPVVNLPPVRFISAPTNQGRTGNIHGAWEPEILVAVITILDITVEEALVNIVMKSRNVVVHMECDGNT